VFKDTFYYGDCTACFFCVNIRKNSMLTLSDFKNFHSFCGVLRRGGEGGGGVGGKGGDGGRGEK
jgi:hypothetical protein